jgi:uncharacterized protein (TIGR02301 family)
MRIIAAAMAFGLLSMPAWAQDRSAAQRDTLVALARVLGEAQALRQACAGEGDPAWRSQFQQMLDVEAPDEAFDLRLRNAFNAGFTSRLGDFPACGPESRMAEAQVALKGRDLAAGLSRAMIRLPPKEDLGLPEEPVAEGAPEG